MLAPGVILTLWHSRGLRDAYDQGIALVLQAAPAVVQMHASVNGIQEGFRPVADQVRVGLPAVAIWAGIGVDGWLSTGRTAAQTAKIMLAAGTAAVEAGALRVVWNGEAAYANYPALGVAVAKLVTTEFARMYPDVAQGFTSYDHPMYHPKPWSAWCSPGTPVDLALPQVYAAPGRADMMAHRGALPAREARALASYAAAIRRGLIEPDVTPDTPDDLDWSPYFQLHSVPTVDTVRVGLKYPLSAYWAAPTRFDAQGYNALLGICGIARLGINGPDAVRVAQKNLGVAADNKYGPQTASALRLPWREG